jgi:hypothetical protein
LEPCPWTEAQQAAITAKAVKRRIAAENRWGWNASALAQCEMAELAAAPTTQRHAESNRLQQLKGMVIDPPLIFSKAESSEELVEEKF